MFLQFKSIEDRRKYGGSAFAEIQYCRFCVGTSERKLVSVDAVDHWDLSSLYIYIEDLEEFFTEYNDVFGKGLYSNNCEGRMDLCGINYYNAEKEKLIIQKIKTHRLKESEILLEWLTSNPYNNGFYLLGI